MTNSSMVRWWFVLAATLMAASCTELPNDIGVRQHRAAIARKTRLASHHPIFAMWNDDKTLKGDPKIVVNLTLQQAFFFRGKVLVGKTNISTGRKGYETPPGKYRVIQKDADHVSSEYGDYVNRHGAVVRRDVDVNRDSPPAGARFAGAPMPYFLRFTEGYGMHAGFVPRFRASHGCIRMPPAAAEMFYSKVKVGTPVLVAD